MRELKLPSSESKVETGLIKFVDNKWPGIYLEADAAMSYSVSLEILMDENISEEMKEIYKYNIVDLITLLNSSDPRKDLNNDE